MNIPQVLEAQETVRAAGLTCNLYKCRRGWSMQILGGKFQVYCFLLTEVRRAVREVAA